jgi:hypothetical protein
MMPKGVSNMLNGILPPTSKRVRLHTKEEINSRISEKTRQNMEYYKTKSREEIAARIEALDKEWDTERALETNAAAVILICIFLGFITRSTGWFIFVGIIAAFLLQHALQGWCPPLPVFRRMGIRTSEEIDAEKFYLKNLLGGLEEKQLID